MGRGRGGTGMTREQIRALLPEGTGEGVVTRLLDAMHREMGARAEDARRMEQLEEKARAYDELLEQIGQERQRAREAQLQEDIDAALREKSARNLKAARALLDIDALREKAGDAAAVKEAVEKLRRSAEGAFLFLPEKTGRRVNIGGENLGSSAPANAEQAIRRAAGLR